MKKAWIVVTGLLFSFCCFGQDDDPIIFRCPPCASHCDTLVFKEKGICHVCNMALYPTYKSLPNTHNMHSSTGFSSKTVAILVFPGVQIIDFTGPWEVFGQAGMRVFTVSHSTQPLRTSMGMHIIPDYSFENMPPADIILLPGGNVDHEDKKIIEWVLKADQQSSLTMSVCNGAYFLGASGLLDGKEATTFASLIPGLKNIAPRANVLTTKRYTHDGKIVTSAGLSSGIDAALHVVAEELGLGRTQQLATNLEYNWDVEGHYVRANLADQYLQGIGSILNQFDPRTVFYAGDKNHWKTQIEISTSLPVRKLLNLIGFQIMDAKGGKLLAQTDQAVVYRISRENNWRVKVDVLEKKDRTYLLSFEVTQE